MKCLSTATTTNLLMEQNDHKTVESVEERLKEKLAEKKYQVEIEIKGKRKFAYLDDLSMLDDVCRQTKAKVIEIIELTKEAEEIG